MHPTNPTQLPFQNIDGNKHLTQGFVERNKIKNENDLKKYLRKQYIIDSGGNINNLDLSKLEKCIEYAIKIKSPFKTMMAQLNAIQKWNGIENLKVINNLSQKFGFNIDIIHGEKDLMINAKNGEFMSENVVKSKYYLLPNEGHLIYITKKGYSVVQTENNNNHSDNNHSPIGILIVLFRIDLICD